MNKTDRKLNLVKEVAKDRQTLFDFFSQEHGLTLTITEMHDIVKAVRSFDKKNATHPTPESEGVEKRIQEFAEEYAGIFEESEIAWHGTNPKEAKEEAARIEKTVVDRLRALLAQARQEEQVSMINRFESCMIDMDTENGTLIVDLDKYGPEFDEIKDRQMDEIQSQLQGGSDE